MQMRVWTGLAAVAASLVFTGPHVAWADDSHSGAYAYADPDGDAQEPPPGVADERWVDSPYAPHHPYGFTMRGGTQVGYVYGKRLDVLALGGAVAAGHRWDRLTIEAEYSYLGFSELGPSSLGLGHAHRYGVTVRAEPLRFGSRIAGANSMLALYAEVTGARMSETWYQPALNQPARIVPDDDAHLEGSIGFGLLIDHRLERPNTLSRVGWLLGWRMLAAPNAPEDYVVCRGQTCARASDPMPMKRTYETALLFTSSLSLTW
jgi:hypothetical protein